MRITLELMDRVVLCRVQGDDGRELGRGSGTTETQARIAAAEDWARREAVLDEAERGAEKQRLFGFRYANNGRDWKPRSATKARFERDAEMLARVRGEKE